MDHAISRWSTLLWASLAWMAASYVLMLTILGVPLGLLMVNRLPFVFSLHRGYA